MQSYKEQIDEIVIKIDDILKELNISLDKFLKIKIAGMILKVIDNDMQDSYLIIEGDGGVGKSNLSGLIGYIVAKITGRPFTHENLFFKTDNAIDFSTKTEKQIVIFDEPAFGGLKRDWRNKTQLHLIQLLFTARKKRHFVIFNLIKFNRFNRDIVEKAIGMIRVYKRNEQDKQRRYFYFNKERISSLMDYAERRKYRAYSKFRIAQGSLPPFVLDKLINNDEYEKSKDEAIASIGVEKTTKAEEKADKRHKLKEGLLQFKILKGFEKLKAKGIPISYIDYCKLMDISNGTPSGWRENLRELGIIVDDGSRKLESLPEN